jgi:hypothetical protein
MGHQSYLQQVVNVLLKQPDNRFWSISAALEKGTSHLDHDGVSDTGV